LKHIIPIVTINILLGQRGVERGGIKIPGKLGRGGRAGGGGGEGGGIQIVTNFTDRIFPQNSNFCPVIQIVTNFTDRIFPQNSNFCPVSLKFHPLKHIIPIVTINILLGRRGVDGVE
jgi:hypothetical protein